MIAALIILIALITVGAILFLLDRRHPSPDVTENVIAESQCCGLHLTCEKLSLAVNLDEPIEYYDDEELDIYKGVAGDCYDEAAIEQFREVLLTLLPGDIAGWARSVQKRGIELPAPIRDELLMIIAEARQQLA